MVDTFRMNISSLMTFTQTILSQIYAITYHFLLVYPIAKKIPRTANAIPKLHNINIKKYNA